MDLLSLDEDCLYSILISNILTTTDLDNLRQTCTVLNDLVITHNLIPKICHATHFTAIPSFCNKYHCFKHEINCALKSNYNSRLVYLFYNSVYNEWIDLIQSILLYWQTKDITLETLENLYIRSITNTIGIIIERGSFRLLDLLFPDGLKLYKQFMHDGLIEFKTISRIIKYNNFEMYNHLKSLELLDNTMFTNLIIWKDGDYIKLTYKKFYFNYDFEYRFEITPLSCNATTLPLKNLGYLIKLYCEDFELTTYHYGSTFTCIEKYFPEYYETLMSRISVGATTS